MRTLLIPVLLTLLLSGSLVYLGPQPAARPESAPSLSPSVRPASPPPLQPPPGAVGSIKIAIHNVMAVPTGPYQQLVHIDSDAYAGLINGNWSNGVPYYTDNDTPLYGWIEANASNRSINTVLWLNMTSIPAGNWSNVSIYFWPKSSFNLSTAGYMGEAPQLSTPYGAYDDGSSVFNFYDNFNGTKLGSDWTVHGSWTDTVKDGFSLNSVPGSGDGIYSTAKFAFPAVMDFYGDLYQSRFTFNGFAEGFGTSACVSCGSASLVGWNSEVFGAAGPTPSTNNKSADSNGKSISSTQEYGVFTSEAVSKSQAIFTFNYTSANQTLTTNIPPSPLPLGIAIASNGNGALSSTETMRWVRERSYVAQMPTFSVTYVPYGVTFNETGLPIGTPWWVNVTGGGPSTRSTTASLSFTDFDGTYGYSVGTTDKIYASPRGNFTVANGPSYMSIVFAPVVYPIAFQETGLPVGTGWWLSVAGQPVVYAGSANLTANETNGTYSYTASSTDPTYGTPGAPFVVSGAPANVSVPFGLLTFGVEFNESGLPVGTPWSVQVSGGPAILSTGDNLTVNEINGSYSYTVASSNRSWAAPAGTFTVDGQSGMETVTFSLVTFAVTFTETGLPEGVTWSVNASGHAPASSTAPTIVLSEPNGSFTFTASRPDRTYEIPTGSFDVAGADVAVSVPYQRVTLSVIFTETGLPDTVTWSVSINGAPHSGTGNIEVAGLVNGSYPYTIGALSGYTASPSTGTILVSGQPVAQSIAFAKVSPASTFLGLSNTEGYLVVFGGVLAAIAVVAIVLLLARRRRPTPPSAPPRRTTSGPPRPGGTRPVSGAPRPRPGPRPAGAPRPVRRPPAPPPSTPASPPDEPV
jgi:hypothetical protein